MSACTPWVGPAHLQSGTFSGALEQIGRIPSWPEKASATTAPESPRLQSIALARKPSLEVALTTLATL